MRTPSGDPFAQRFFERQRREIMARIGEQQRARRRERWYGLALAAAAMLLTAMAFTVIEGPTHNLPSGQAWLAEAGTPDSLTGEDPLAVFGSWDLASLGGAASANEESSLLPPLGSSAVEAVDDPLEWMPPLTGDETLPLAGPEQGQG